MRNSLRVKTDENVLNVFKYGTITCGIIYFIVGLLGAVFFGAKVEVNVLTSIGKEDDRWESYVLRCLFGIILACHIPFIFFSGKEAALIVIDEFNRKSISRAIQLKMSDATLSRRDSKEEDLVKAPVLPNRERRNSLAYHEMSYVQYFTVTTVCYITCLIFSIFIKDISYVFEVLSAVCVSFIAFIFPGWFYLVALSKFGSGINSPRKYEAILYIILGCLSFGLMTTSSIISIVKGIKGK